MSSSTGCRGGAGGSGCGTGSPIGRVPCRQLMRASHGVMDARGSSCTRAKALRTFHGVWTYIGSDLIQGRARRPLGRIARRAFPACTIVGVNHARTERMTVAEEVTSKRAQALAGGEDDGQGRDTTSNGRGSEKASPHRMAATPGDRAPSAPRRRFTASDVEPRMETRETGPALSGQKKIWLLTKAFV